MSSNSNSEPTEHLDYPDMLTPNPNNKNETPKWNKSLLVYWWGKRISILATMSQRTTTYVTDWFIGYLDNNGHGTNITQVMAAYTDTHIPGKTNLVKSIEYLGKHNDHRKHGNHHVQDNDQHD